MTRKTFQVRILWRLITALILALCLVPISSNPVVAQSPQDYFSFSYDVEFSKTEIEGSEVFYSTITVVATCTNDFPVSASEASITGRIIAEHQASGTEVTLNSSYTITIKPFPNQKGETTESSVVIPLQFPQGSQSGTYSVVGELIEAKVKAIFWLPVTAFLPSSQTVGSVTYVSGSYEVGGIGGGGGGGGGLAGITSVLNSITENGRFTEDVIARSEDGKVELTIYKDTIGLNRVGQLISSILIKEKEEPPDPPEDSSVIGLVYDLGPSGTTFEPPVTITFTYDPAAIPEGVAEEDLVIAYWDAGGVKWVVLESITVDLVSHTISGQVSHFTAFSAIAYTRPAALNTSDLTISPAEVNTGESVSISAKVANTGDLAGSYEVSLRIDNATVAIKEVTLKGGASEEITFTIAEDVAGTYAVTVDGLSGEFVVRGPATFVASELSITPAEVAIDEGVTISTLITNTSDLAGSYKVSLRIDNITVATKKVTLKGGASEEVTFTIAEDVAGTYAVTVDGLSGEFVVREPATVVARIPPKPITWWSLGGIIAACIALVMVISIAVIRRRRRRT